jgi:hypothetical protein
MRSTCAQLGRGCSCFDKVQGLLFGRLRPVRWHVWAGALRMDGNAD